jgi:cobalt-zinc-cadmium efflux system outer membrane protein
MIGAEFVRSRARIVTRHTAVIVFTMWSAATAGAEPTMTATTVPPSDAVLDGLIADSLAARPELQQAEAISRAEHMRVPQAGAFPDPVLSLGIQNDGFNEIQIGDMETSFYQIMLSQGLPWPGKRGLRTDVARLTAEQADSLVSRMRLTTEADVRRSYVDLLLVRDRLVLLDQLDALWEKSAGVARALYESGSAAQSDVLRSQLEINRLRQRRAVLTAQEQTTVQALNRMRAHPLDEPIVTGKSIRDLGVPALAPLDAATASALEKSPELALARMGVSRAEKMTALALRERFPDVNLNLGVMPRGELDPMWLAGVSVPLPIWSYRKQGPAVDESEARSSAAAFGAAALEQILRLRVAERNSTLHSLLEIIRPYQEGLLVQSQATAESTLAQYRVGNVTFASVLEANAGYINDEESFLSALADAHRVEIAEIEISLEALGGIGGGTAAMGGAPMPGAAAIPTPPTGTAAPGAPAPGAASGTSMPGAGM